MKIWKSRTVPALLAGTIMALSPLELAAQETERYIFDIPAQDLGDALRTVAAKADWELYAAADEINGISALALHGDFTAKEAIERLLQGTTLVARFDKGSVVIRGRSGFHVSANQAPEEAIVVTGTRIEGAPPAAPVITVTSQDIKNAGLADLGEVARSLPQNFGGGQNPGMSAVSANGTDLRL